MRRSAFVTALILAITGMIAGCGGTSTTGTTPSNTPPPTNPPSSPPTQASGAFTESMLANDGSGTVAGQVTITPNGSGSISLSGTTPNSSYTIQFCPFADPNRACTNITSTTSSMSGTISLNFTFPGHGGFAGIFQASSGSTASFVSGFNVPSNGVFQAPLVRASTIGNGLGSEGSVLGIGFDPLKSGSANLSGQTAHFQLQGAAANQSYGLTFCRNGGGSSCFALNGQITTDASGNGSGDFQLASVLGTSTDNAGVFLLGTGKPPAVQFVTGFTMP